MFEMTIAVLLEAVFISSRHTYQVVSVLQRQAKSRFNADSCLRLKGRQSVNPRPSPLPLDKNYHPM